MSTSVVQEVLQALYDEGQELTPRLVLDRARDPQHPLHDRFEWDDAKAAESHRLTQAGDLIRSVRVTYQKADGSEGRVRNYHSVRRDDGARVYKTAESVAMSPVMTQALLAEMRRDWSRMRDRYGRFEEFAALVANDPILQPQAS